MTGRRYSLGFNGDPAGDGVTNNELLFVPASASDVVVYNGTWEQLDAYISQDPGASKYRGQIMPRNAARAPWQNQMDLQYALNIPTGGRTKAEITVNVINFLNLLNSDWGWQYWAPFPGLGTAIGYGGIDARRRARCATTWPTSRRAPGAAPSARRPAVAVADAVGRAVQVLAGRRLAGSGLQACGLSPDGVAGSHSPPRFLVARATPVRPRPRTLSRLPTPVPTRLLTHPDSSTPDSSPDSSPRPPTVIE